MIKAKGHHVCIVTLYSPFYDELLMAVGSHGFSQSAINASNPIMPDTDLTQLQ